MAEQVAPIKSVFDHVQAGNKQDAEQWLVDNKLSEFLAAYQKLNNKADAQALVNTVQDLQALITVIEGLHEQHGVDAETQSRLRTAALKELTLKKMLLRKMLSREPDKHYKADNSEFDKIVNEIEKLQKGGAKKQDANAKKQNVKNEQQNGVGNQQPPNAKEQQAGCKALMKIINEQPSKNGVAVSKQIADAIMGDTSNVRIIVPYKELKNAVVIIRYGTTADAVTKAYPMGSKALFTNFGLPHVIDIKFIKVRRDENGKSTLVTISMYNQPEFEVTMGDLLGFIQPKGQPKPVEMDQGILDKFGPNDVYDQNQQKYDSIPVNNQKKIMIGNTFMGQPLLIILNKSSNKVVLIEADVEFQIQGNMNYFQFVGGYKDPKNANKQMMVFYINGLKQPPVDIDTFYKQYINGKDVNICKDLNNADKYPQLGGGGNGNNGETIVLTGSKWQILTKKKDNNRFNYLRFENDNGAAGPGLHAEYKEGEIVKFTDANKATQQFTFNGIGAGQIMIKKNGGKSEQLTTQEMDAYLTDSFTFSAQSDAMYGDYYDENVGLGGFDEIGGYGQHYIHGYDHQTNGRYVQSIGTNGVDSMQFVYATLIAMFIAVCFCCLCTVCGGIGAFAGYWIDNVMQKMNKNESKYAIVNENGDESEV